MRLRILGLLLAVVAAGPVTVGSAAIIENGNFEAGTDPGSGFRKIPSNGSINNWTVSSGSVDYIGSFYQSDAGSRVVSLNGFEAGALSQDLTTSVGVQYDVSFQMSASPGRVSNNEIEVSVGDFIGQFTFDSSANTPAAMGYITKTFSFIASAITTLTFESLIAGELGAVIDNVTVTPTVDPNPNVVPEPASMTAWALLGLAGAGASWRRRRKAVTA